MLTVRTALSGVLQRRVQLILFKYYTASLGICSFQSYRFSGQIDVSGEVVPGAWEDCSPDCPHPHEGA